LDWLASAVSDAEAHVIESALLARTNDETQEHDPEEERGSPPQVPSPLSATRPGVKSRGPARRTAERVLARARGELGIKEDPPGSNRVPYSEWYGVIGPWCAMFVSWCLYQEGIPLPATTAKGFAYTPAGVAWLRRQGRWTHSAAPGNLVFFNFPGDDVDRVSHVGFIESILDDGTFVTLEGNTDRRGSRTGGQVMRRYRSRVGVVGFGAPPYDTQGGGAESPYPGHLLRKGTKDRHVRILQARLLQLGVATLQLDGEYGPDTVAAVKKFQAARGLKEDGVVGPRTWTALWDAG